MVNNQNREHYFCTQHNAILRLDVVNTPGGITIQLYIFGAEHITDSAVVINPEGHQAVVNNSAVMQVFLL